MIGKRLFYVADYFAGSRIGDVLAIPVASAVNHSFQPKPAARASLKVASNLAFNERASAAWVAGSVAKHPRHRSPTLDFDAK